MMDAGGGSELDIRRVASVCPLSASPLFNKVMNEGAYPLRRVMVWISLLQTSIKYQNNGRQTTSGLIVSNPYQATLE